MVFALCLFGKLYLKKKNMLKGLGKNLKVGAPLAPFLGDVLEPLD